VAVFSFSITITGKAFEHRASEVSYIVQQMNSISAALQGAEGNLASGTILGVDPVTNAANTPLATFAYTAGALLP
jgi:hypothetical protein